MVWFVAVAWPLVVMVKERCAKMPNEIVNGLFSKKGVKMKKSGMHKMPNGKMMKMKVSLILNLLKANGMKVLIQQLSWN